MIGAGSRKGALGRDAGALALNPQPEYTEGPSQPVTPIWKTLPRPRPSGIAVLLVVLVLGGLPVNADEAVLATEEKERNPLLERVAWQPGEFLNFDVFWSGVPVGNSTMSVAAGAGADGEPETKLVTTARSNDFLSVFYPVKDHIVSHLDPATDLPRRIEIDQRHGKRKRIRNTVFDRERQVATTYQKNREPHEVAIPPRVHDILSCFYYFRNVRDLVPGQTTVIDVHEGKKNWRLLVHVLNKETVTVPAGEFHTVQVKAEVRFRGVFYDRGDVRLWLTDNVLHIPVKVRVKIQLGAVVLDLVDIRLPAPSKPVPSEIGGPSLNLPS